MGFNPEIHHRRSIRLQGYDYSTEGAYFVTVCVRDGECLFGEVADGEMRLNDAGRMVLATWNELRTHYPRVHVDVHIVMPNHFHGIVFLRGGVIPPSIHSRSLRLEIRGGFLLHDCH